MSQWSAQPFFPPSMCFFSVKWKKAAASLQSKPKSQIFVFYWDAVEVCRSSSQPKARLRKQSSPQRTRKVRSIFLVQYYLWGQECVHEFVWRLSEGKSLKLLCLWDSSMMSPQDGKRVVLPHLLLDLLVSVIQGNLFSALPHDGFCVAVAAKQGESWLLKQAHKGFCSEKSKAAISASPDSCLFCRGCHRQPTHPFVSPLELALNKEALWTYLPRSQSFLQHNEEILLCGHHTAHKISSSYQSLFSPFLKIKKIKKTNPQPQTKQKRS